MLRGQKKRAVLREKVDFLVFFFVEVCLFMVAVSKIILFPLSYIILSFFFLIKIDGLLTWNETKYK